MSVTTPSTWSQARLPIPCPGYEVTAPPQPSGPDRRHDCKYT